jgi:hypothetical protein
MLSDLLKALADGIVGHVVKGEAGFANVVEQGFEFAMEQWNQCSKPG